jgi:UDP-N-acetylglucosamine 2-epimerase (non-hydrolysing)
MKPVIDIIAGARPNFVKIAPLFKRLRETESEWPFAFRLIHTGQHYDYRLSQSFFDDLGIPEPDINLEVGSGTHAQQTANIMVAYEKVLLQAPCNLCLVFGDVTSTLACALTAKKLHIPVGHVEGGIRSGDQTMPEEINRLVTDSIADWFFVTTSLAKEQLIKEGHDAQRIFLVGNLMIDNLFNQLPNLKTPEIFHQLEAPKDYLLLTLHRPSNVDVIEGLEKILATITNAVALPILFPVHPRTRTKLENLKHRYPTIHFLEPLPYLEFVFLLKNACGILTDSGGITEEASVLNIPCITLRDSTERPETITLGTNVLAGNQLDNLQGLVQKMVNQTWKQGATIPFWDGQTSARILEQLRTIF